MKRKFYLLCIMVAGLSLVQCSDDDSDQPAAPSGTLFVDGQNFTTGTNDAVSSLNTMIAHETAGFTTKSFTISESNSVNPTAADVLTVVVSYETFPATGLFSLFSEDDMTVPTNYALASLSEMPGNVLYGESQISGSVKVINNGDGNYRMEFNDVVMAKNDDVQETRTITGYCEIKFNVISL